MTQPSRTWNDDPIISIRGRFAIDAGGYVYQRLYGTLYCGGPEVLTDHWDIVGTLYRIQLDDHDSDLLEELIEDYEWNEGEEPGELDDGSGAIQST
jgi:hypothetical protein